MIRVVNVRGLNRPEQRACVCYVGRAFAGWPAHPLGNPFRPKPGFDAIQAYRNWLAKMPDLETQLAALWEQSGYGAKPLGCWCCEAVAGDGSEVVCHAQYLAELLRERFCCADFNSKDGNRERDEKSRDNAEG